MRQHADTQIGIVHMRKRTDSWYYTTPFVQVLTGGVDVSAKQVGVDLHKRNVRRGTL
jgi:hypothetical protein